MKLILSISALLFLWSCRKDPGIITPLPEMDSLAPMLPETMYDYESILYPSHIANDPVLAPIFNLNSANPVTNEGATLGRVLFYDKNLSFNNAVSCASCHHQEHAFSDTAIFSKGFQGDLTGRNAMAIYNVNINSTFFWDSRAATIEEQALMPVQHPFEMGMTLDQLEVKLTALSYYKTLFETAFGSTEITSTRIALALGQFMKAMRSFRSKYDQGVENNFASFTPQEMQGHEIFTSEAARCSNCHNSQNFGGITQRNNGLDAVFSDEGIGALTGNSSDIGKFKSTSLRNIELTAPYMHDGRFKTLEDVVDYYSADINAHPNLDDLLTTNMTVGGPPLQLDFTKSERAALVAFLKTLTDYEFINDIRYSNPFMH